MFQLPGVGALPYKECTSFHFHKGAANSWGSRRGHRSGQRKNRNGQTAATAVPQIADTMLLYNFFLFYFFFFHFKLLLPSVPFCHLEFMLQLK